MMSRSSLLLLYKKAGITSFSSLKPVKRTIDRKVGHAGTLDKFAEGLMIVLTGSYTKLNPLLSELDKRYEATIMFGSETSTLDPEGDVVATAEAPHLDTIRKVLEEQFLGTIVQSPPVYSAVHIDGKRAYRLARSGEDVKMPEREITIFSLDILTWESPLLRVAVHCSKGTYIRSLARDIAVSCGSRGHLIALKRTAIGPFSLDEAVDPEDAEALSEHTETSGARLLRIPRMGSMTVDAQAAKRLMYGNLPPRRAIIATSVVHGDTFATVQDGSGRILAVVGIDGEGVPIKVFSLPCMESRI